MFRPSLVRAAAITLLLAGAAPPLVFAAGNPPRTGSPRLATLSVVWSSLRDLIAFVGHEVGLLSPDSGHGMDPNGLPTTSPDSGHEMDPNG